MVKRSAAALLAALLCGCPDDIGGGGGVVTGLRAPAELKGVPNGGSEIVLTWKDRASNETGYRIEMNFSPFNTPFIGGVEFLPGDATSHVFPAFPNSTYYFRVFAVTAVMESDPSDVIVVSTPDVPERPVGVAASPQTTTQIFVQWGDVLNETGYRVEASSDEGETWLPKLTVSPNLSQATLSGLNPDAEYVVRVIAFNSHGDSTPSSKTRTSTLSNLVSFATASGANTGKYPSYRITPQGEEHLSHVDVGSTNVLYTRKLPAGSYSTMTVDAGPTGFEDVGGDGTSITTDNFGTVMIAAHDRNSDRLRFITNESGLWASGLVEFLTVGKGGARPKIFWDTTSGKVHFFFQQVWMAKPVIMRICRVGPKNWVLPAPFPVEADFTATFSACLDPEGTRHLAIVSLQRELWYFEDSAAMELGTPQEPAPGVRIPLPSSSCAPDFTAIAVSGSTVHVVFHDGNSGGLYHATQASGSWVTQTIDLFEGQDVGRFCASAIHPPTGRLHVAYYDGSNRDLKYARKDPGGSWVRKVLDAAGDVGSHASIALDPAGKVHIAYRDETNQQLKVATGTP
jgi:hypothetical protein